MAAVLWVERQGGGSALLMPGIVGEGGKKKEESEGNVDKRGVWLDSAQIPAL